jgi:hypothetical protein
MTASTEEKIQKLELETVKAVTEMRADIKNLTYEVKKLNETIVKMSENYVTKEEHAEDILSLKGELRDAKRLGMIRTILYTALGSSITAIIVYEVMKITQ